MNVNKVLTKGYENIPLCRHGKNKPNLSGRSLRRSRIKPNPKGSKPGRFDSCLALDFPAFSMIGLMNSITKHLVLWIIESFLNIFGSPCVIIRKTALIVHKEALSISRAKTGFMQGTLKMFTNFSTLLISTLYNSTYKTIDFKKLADNGLFGCNTIVGAPSQESLETRKKDYA
jgi:hypothetical protein